ncbi:MAG: galactokinase family protein, partial [Lachnospiraceae bacterium]|nr:galactokinase family protein [Lachnospiraceae bacterium]
MDLNTLFESGKLEDVYGNDTGILSYQKKRIENAFKGYAEHFGEEGELHLFSAAGRSEIGGNHTDHQ